MNTPILIIFSALALVSSGLSLPQIRSTKDGINPSSILDGQVKQAILDFVHAIPDPLKVDSFAINLSDGLPMGIKGNISVSNLNLTEIQTLTIDKLSLTSSLNEETPRLNFTFSFLELTLDTLYTANIIQTDTLLATGNGKIKVEIENPQITGTTLFTIHADDVVQLQELQIKIHLDKGSKAVISGLEIEGVPVDDDMN